MVAVVAHAFSIVLLILMWAFNYLHCLALKTSLAGGDTALGHFPLVGTTPLRITSWL
jgi:hypothetical protein